MWDRLHHHLLATSVVIDGAVFGGTAVTMLLWNISASDVSVIVSALASMLALTIQFWVARAKIKALKEMAKRDAALDD